MRGVFILIFLAIVGNAQGNESDQLREIERRVDDLQREVDSVNLKLTSVEWQIQHLLNSINDSSTGVSLILFGAFCALWAQNTDRNPWLWFFMGLLFSVVTVIVLLVKNSNDQYERQPQL